MPAHRSRRAIKKENQDGRYAILINLQLIRAGESWISCSLKSKLTMHSLAAAEDWFERTPIRLHESLETCNSLRAARRRRECCRRGGGPLGQVWKLGRLCPNGRERKGSANRRKMLAFCLIVSDLLKQLSLGRKTEIREIFWDGNIKGLVSQFWKNMRC